MQEKGALLVSVIVPIYKVEPYLYRCVKSIIDQTYCNLEIILIDDGSPDRCGQICDDLSNTDNRIKVIHQDNQGLSCARNAGIESCNGSFIFFVDGDDYIDINTIQCLLKACIDTGSEAACCGYIQENKKNSVVFQVSDEVLIYEEKDILPAYIIHNAFDVATWNKLWSKRLFDSGIRFPKNRIYEDIATTYKILDNCHRISCVPDALYHYTVRKDSISNTINMKNLVDRWLAFKEQFDELSERSEDYYNKCMVLCLEAIGRTWRWLYGMDKKERNEYRDEIVKMRAFLLGNRKCIKLCPPLTRFSLQFVVHSNETTIFICYLLNKVYRTIRDSFSGIFNKSGVSVRIPN